MSERVLITGATGFFGSHIARAFAGAGWPLRCSVRATSDTRWIADLEPELISLDLSGDGAAAAPAVEGVGVVVHNAGITRSRSDEAFRRINTEATETLGRAAAEAGVRQFIFISSLAARGPDGMDAPVSPYGWSKREAEERLQALPGQMEIVSLRPGGIYGPRDSALLQLFKLASKGLLVAPRSGELQPVYAADAADAVLRAASGQPGFGPFPVVEPTRYGWDEVAAALDAALGRRVRRVTVPAAFFVSVGWVSELVSLVTRKLPDLDRRRARDLASHSWTSGVETTSEALGWEPHVLLPDGLARTAEWYRKEGWL